MNLRTLFFSGKVNLLVKSSSQRKGTMTIRRTFQGAIEIYESDKKGYLVTRQYFGYSLAEAKQKFREELKEINAKY